MKLGLFERAGPWRKSERPVECAAVAPHLAFRRKAYTIGTDFQWQRYKRLKQNQRFIRPPSWFEKGRSPYTADELWYLKQNLKRQMKADEKKNTFFNKLLCLLSIGACPQRRG